MSNGLSPNGLEHEELFAQVVTLIKEYVTNRSSGKVVEFKRPDELRELVDIELQDQGIDDGSILELCQAVLKYSVRTNHPHFFNQLFTGIDEIGLIAQMVTAVTNTSMYTFEMAPLFSIMEQEVLCKMRELAGWKDGRGDGIFSPGGSISNLYGLILARYKKFPESKARGIHGLPQMVILCSEDSHYSILKSSFMMGIGMENVIKVKADSRGKMVVEELEKAITESRAKGQCPLAVVATAATTILGSFDPLEEIAAVCQRHSIWMHVDGCFGGSVLLSQKHRGLAAGMELVDSFSWNPHKSMGVPLQCSAFLTQHEDLMKESNSTKATYLFQRDKMNYNVAYDTGDKSFQCGRLNDVLKLWLMWKQRGTSGFEQRIDYCMDMASCLTEKIREREGFQLVIENPEYTNVCFWYFPPKMRDLQPFKPSEKNSVSSSRLSKVAPTIKARMISKGSVMMTYQPMKELPNFFRMTLTTPASEEDVDWLLNEIELLGSDINIEA